MVAAASFSKTVLCFLATSSKNIRNAPKRKSVGSTLYSSKTTGSGIGRQRYGRSGQKIDNDKGDGERSRSSKTRRRKRNYDDGAFSHKETDKHAPKATEMALYSPLPPLTTPNDVLPTYFSCRHTYEQALMDEIQRHVKGLLHERHIEPKSTADEYNPQERVVSVTSPSPGLIRVDDPDQILPRLYDPVYALQILPDAIVVKSTSIKGLSKTIYGELLGSNDEYDLEENKIVGDEGHAASDKSKSRQQRRQELLREELRAAPRGCLAIHALAPGCCKGQRNPVLLNRSQRVAEELSETLRKGFAAARKLPKELATDDEAHPGRDENQRWVLQVMLIQPDLAIASIVKCQHIGPGWNYWPNWHHSLGMAKVDITDVSMPSSAYRKLMEALECMRIRPSSSSSTVVDLGACPGGWTTVLRKYFDCSVIAVDRTELDPALMIDEMVEFRSGDAFAFVPLEAIQQRPSSSLLKPTQPRNLWMISDVIAYPDRVIELLERWCGGHWATIMIVTMKFQGTKPSLADLEVAFDTAKRYGYICRAKHFFNNKNEVTLMLHHESASTDGKKQKKERSEDETIGLLLSHLDNGVLGSSMYPVFSPM